MDCKAPYNYAINLIYLLINLKIQKFVYTFEKVYFVQQKWIGNLN